MGDLSGILPFGGSAMIRYNSDSAPAPAVPTVESSLPAKGSGGEASSNKGNSDQSDGQAQARQPKVRVDPYTPTGPSPAFQANVLEMEHDLRQSIARLEAARGMRESYQVEGQARQRQPEPKAEKPAEPQFDTPETTDAAEPENKAATDVLGGSDRATGPEDRQSRPD